MNKRFRIGVFLVLVGSIISALYILPPREPVYDGKRLSDWLEDLAQRTRPIKRNRAKDAVSRMGTNALPALLEMLRSSDPFLKRLFVELIEKQSMFHLHS